MPGDRDYDRVNMNKGIGERWFCLRLRRKPLAGGMREKDRDSGPK